MTPEGSADLKTELAALKKERPKISAEIGEAADHGDLKENAEYHAARERQGIAEARIRDIEDKLSRAEVIDSSRFTGDRVRFGAYVTLEDSDSGKELKYRIVGPAESDTSKGSISVTSPVAKALIGREEGDEVTVRSPGGTHTYEIVEVRWAQ